MDKELKAKWVAALRSGDWVQLRGDWSEQPNKACCLGVLLNITGRADGDDYQSPRGTSAELIGVDNYGDELTALIQMNDGSKHNEPKSFAEIADYIEANL